MDFVTYHAKDEFAVMRGKRKSCQESNSFCLERTCMHVVPLIEQLEIKTYMPGLGLGLEQRYAAFLAAT